VLDVLGTALTWVLNGGLVIAYVITEYLIALLLIPGLTWLTADMEEERRGWMGAASLLSISSALFAPLVVGVWLNLMAYGSLLAIRIEKFNRSQLRWRVVSGQSAYALIGLGFFAYEGLAPLITSDSALFAQGQGYLNVIINLAVWIMPLGYVGLLVQSVWVHPPEAQTPEETLTHLRTRGRR
jgi:hypothetical protein